MGLSRDSQWHTGSLAGSVLESQVAGFKACFGGEELQRAAAAMAGSLVGGTITAYLAVDLPPSCAQLSTLSTSSQQQLEQSSRSPQHPRIQHHPAELLAGSSNLATRELAHAARIYQQLEDGIAAGREGRPDTTPPLHEGAAQLPAPPAAAAAAGGVQGVQGSTGGLTGSQGAAADSKVSCSGNHMEAPEQEYDLLYGHGLVLQELATRALQGSHEQGTLLKEACRKYEKALRLQPTSHTSTYNLGVAQSDLARLTRATDPAAARQYLESAATCYADALRLHPDNPQALNNWGLVLQELAGEMRDRRERDACLRQAQAKFRHAVRMRPDFNRGCYNLGTVCYSAACTLQGELAMLGPAGVNEDGLTGLARLHEADNMGPHGTGSRGVTSHSGGGPSSVLEAQEAERQRAGREAEVRGLFNSSAQYIMLASALHQGNEVYRKSLTVVKQLLPLPFLRAGYLTAPVPGAGREQDPWHRDWFVLDHSSLRAATSRESSLSTATAAGLLVPSNQTATSTADSSAQALTLPLEQVNRVQRVDDPTLPPGAGFWVCLHDQPLGVFLVADNEDDADAWADALMLCAYIVQTRSAQTLAQALC
ncbi:hypothetical protein QJQ45_021888 [Haematococcus lacustris]|nr:hypothetical protein QJQ45_021888 [Haematococcus lacustris]